MDGLLIPKYRTEAREQRTFVYFENVLGRIVIPPAIDGPTPDGYIRKEIQTRNIREVEAVSRRFNAQKQSDFAQMNEAQQARIEAAEAIVRSNLNARLASNISNYERDFIRGALKRMQELRPKKIVRPEGHLTMEATEAPTR
jgi:hypothetical protein